jgi:antitoxin component YwqK of YwqJK toxin-antitoxin module
MEKFKSSISKIFLFLLIYTNCSCQDSRNVEIIPKSNGSFNVNKNNLEVLTLNFWDDSNKLGMIFLPNGKNGGLKIGISYSGQIISKTEVVLINDNFIENGKSMKFNDKGELFQIYTYKNGFIDGAYLSYHGNGICEVKGSYKDGEAIGTWYYYDDFGKLIKTEKKYPSQSEH